MIKIKLSYNKLGWVSLYDHQYRNFFLTFRDSKVFTIPKESLPFYEKFTDLGVTIKILDEVRVDKELPLEETTIEVIDEIEESSKEEQAPDLEAINKLSKIEIQQLLRELDIDYKTSDTKATLIERLGAFYDGE